MTEMGQYTVTDDYVIDRIRDAITKGWGEATSGSTDEPPKHYVAIVRADQVDTIAGVPYWVYVREENAYGRHVTYYYPDLENAEDYFDAATIDHYVTRDSLHGLPAHSVSRSAVQER